MRRFLNYTVVHCRLVDCIRYVFNGKVRKSEPLFECLKVSLGFSSAQASKSDEQIENGGGDQHEG